MHRKGVHDFRMKKIKLILTAAVLFNLLAAVSAFAADAYVPGEFLKALGIVDRAESESDKITRGEYAGLIAKAIRIDSSMAVLPSFEDVPETDPNAQYIETLASLEIIKGFGGYFEPERSITVDEASRIAIRALGCRGSLIRSDETTLRSDLTRSLGKLYSEELTYSDAYAIICKMLMSDIMKAEYSEDASFTYQRANDVTMLSEYWELDEIEGIVTANKYTHLYNSEIFVPKGVMIGDTRYADSSGYASGLLGRNTVAYANRDGDIVFAYSEDNEELEIKASDVEGYDNYRLEYETGGRIKYAKLSKDFTIIKNGRVVEYSPDFLPEYGYVRLIDNDRDGEYEVMITASYSYGIFEGGSEFRELIYDQNSSELITSYREEANKHIAFYRQNEESGVLEECEAYEYQSGDVLRYVISDDFLNIEVYACSSSVTGRYTAIDSDYMYIDGNPYETAPYFDRYYKRINIGDENTFYLSDDGLVVAADINLNKYLYGYLLNAAVDIDNDDQLILRILTSSGEIKVFQAAEKLYLDDSFMEEKDSRVINALKNADGTKKYQLIKYGVNSKGEINVIDTEASSYTVTPYEEPQKERDALYKNYDYAQNNNQKLTFKGENSYLYYGSNIVARMNSSTVVFIVPSMSSGAEYDDKEFKASNMSAFVNDTSYIVDVYDIGETGIAKCVVISSAASSDFDNLVNNYKNYKFGVVDSVVTAVNDDGIAVPKIYYWQDGEFRNTFLAEDAYNHADAQGTDDGLALGSGDIFTFNTDGNNEIDMYRIYYDFSEQKDVYAIKDAMYLVNLGKVSIRDGSEAVFIKSTDETSRVPVSFSAKYAIVNSKGKVSHGSINDILSIKNAGESNATNMFVWARYTKVGICVIYIEE